MSKANKGTVQNWILIVIIILIVGGGIFAWQYWGARKEVSLPAAGEQEEVIPPEEETVDLSSKALATEDWKTYRNEEYGFEVKYPLDWEQKAEKNYIGFFILEKVADFGPNELGIRIYSKPTDVSLNEWVQELEDVKSETEIQGEAPIGKFYTINNSRFYLIDLINFMGGNIIVNAFIEKDGRVIRFVKDLLTENGRNTFNQILSTFRFIK